MDRIKVIKGNKIVRVTENELEKYLSKGYVIKDGGKLSSKATQPTPKKYEPISAPPLYKEKPKAVVEDVAKEDTPKVKKTQRRSRKK